MNSLQKYQDRVVALISLADTTLATAKHPPGIGISTVDRELFNELKTSSLSFILSLYGEKHIYYKDFDKYLLRPKPSETERARGILKAIKSEIVNGWLCSVKGLVLQKFFMTS